MCRGAMASRAVIAIATISTSLVASWVHAEDAPAPGALQLEEVTATATKRVESLQTVPVSVTALTAGCWSVETSGNWATW
jgi:hypothetical protein